MKDAPPADAERVRIAILGAGMSGVCIGAQLKQRGMHDFVLLEKADAIGGTWRENTYPGIACDVPSHLYSFSFALNPNWSHSYSSGGEIWRYCEETAAQYKLRPHIRFNTEVQNAKWDAARARWRIALSGGRQLEAQIVVSALGGLHTPKHPDIPGLESFAGARFHTAEWDHNCNTEGRRVGIIGTGASAVQVLPEIAPKAAHVSVFQRSAAWVFPRIAREISPRRRARYRRFPWLMRLHRWFLFTLLDVTGVLALRREGALAARTKKIALKHLRAVKDPALRARLTPSYEPGCKRRCISDDYLPAFNRPNVQLVSDAITRVEANGVRDAAGKLHELDVLICATGFHPFNISSHVEVQGEAGARLHESWGERVESFRTLMAPGFPNFFFLLGPNSGTGHTSALIMIESQTQYILRCLRWMKRDGLELLDPKPKVVKTYNRRLQRDLKKMVFSGGCNAWYTDANDVNFTLWPYSAVRFIAELWRIRKREFRTA